jgi:hypothetical protein
MVASPVRPYEGTCRPTGRGTTLTTAVEECRVAAELCRRNLLATPVAGNVPHDDSMASGERVDSSPCRSRQSTAPTGPSTVANGSTSRLMASANAKARRSQSRLRACDVCSSRVARPTDVYEVVHMCETVPPRQKRPFLVHSACTPPKLLIPTLTQAFLAHPSHNLS